MRYLLLLASVIAATVFGLYGFGANLPESYTVRRSVVYAEPVEGVWDAITGYDSMPQWSSHVARTERRLDRDEKAVWRIYDRNGHYMDVQVELADPPHYYKTRIVDTDLPFAGTWAFELLPAAGGTQLTLTEEGAAPNPFARVFLHFFVGKETYVDRHLSDLAAKFQKSPTAP